MSVASARNNNPRQVNLVFQPGLPSRWQASLVKIKHRLNLELTRLKLLDFLVNKTRRNSHSQASIKQLLVLISLSRRSLDFLTVEPVKAFSRPKELASLIQ